MASDWNLNVGLPLLITLMISLITSPCQNIAEYFIARVKRLKDRQCHFFSKRTRRTSQKALNEMYMGGDFKLDKRYATQTSVAFSILFFSSAMPFLYIFAALGFGFHLIVDQWLFVYFYRKPPVYDMTLSDNWARIMPYGIWLHLMMALWVYSSPDIFDIGSKVDVFDTLNTNMARNKTSFGDNPLDEFYTREGVMRVFKTPRNTFVLAALTLITTHLFFRDCLVPILKKFSGYLKVLPCFHDCIGDDFFWEDNPPYLQSINTETLESRIEGNNQDNVLSPEMIEKYEKELKRRSLLSQRGGRRAAKRGSMMGNSLETYRIEANDEYTSEYQRQRRKNTLASKTIVESNDDSRWSTSMELVIDEVEENSENEVAKESEARWSTSMELVIDEVEEESAAIVTEPTGSAAV